MRLSRTRKLVAPALLALSLNGWSHAANTTWISPVASAWAVDTNWNNGTPTLGSTAFIDGGAAGASTVSISGPVLRGVGTLNISAGDTLTIGNSAGLELTGNGATTSLINNGRIVITATGSPTGLVFSQTSFGTISGNGTILMSGAGTGIVGAATARVFNNGNTIRGGGNIGAGSIAFTNNGTIIAEGTVGLTIQPNDLAGIGFINNGLLTGSNGSLFLTGISGGTFLNNGSIISARLTANAMVSGGTLSGVTRIVGGAFLSNVINTIGSTILAEGSTLTGEGRFINNGSILLSNIGEGGSEFRMLGDATLTGGGLVVLNHRDSGIGDAGGVVRLKNENNVIRGQGYIRGVSLDNDSLILADVPGATLTITRSLSPGTFSNSGFIEARNGGTLVLAGIGLGNVGTFNNSIGELIAQANSHVRLTNNPLIVGGRITSENTNGLFTIPTSQRASFLNVTNFGANVRVENNGSLRLAGTFFDNSGTITLAGNENPTDFVIESNLTVTGGGLGRIILSGVNAGITGNLGNTLTNASGHTIEGAGQLGRNEISIINNGTILANVHNGTLSINPRNGGAFSNGSFGYLGATNTGRLNFDGAGGGTFNLSNGTLVIDTNAWLCLSNGAVLDLQTVAGSPFRFLSASGSSSFTATNVQFSNLMIGTGALVKVRPNGGAPGTSRTRAITIADGKLDIANNDLIVDHDGSSTIDTLRTQIGSAYSGGAWTGNGITSSNATAAAATADKTALGYAEATDILGTGGGTFSGQFVDATTLLVRYTLPGDTNLDRTVNISDFARVAANFNQPSQWFRGDFNYDGTTNINDFALLAANFNKTLPADLPGDWSRGAAIPEPVSSSALLISSLGVARFRRRGM